MREPWMRETWQGNARLQAAWIIWKLYLDMQPKGRFFWQRRARRASERMFAAWDYLVETRDA